MSLLRLASLALLTSACSSTPSTPNDGGGGDDGSTEEDAGEDATPPGDDAAVDAGWDSSRPDCVGEAHKIGTVNRTAKSNPYLTYVPAAYDKEVPNTMVVGLHGAGDTAPNFFAGLWKANADKRNFIVIAPEATSPLGPGYTWNSSDATLIFAAIDDVQKCYSIDPKKIILHGFSAGGIMAFWIGLDKADVFSGIAINSADLSSAESINGGSLLPAPWKIPVSHTHGQTDGNFPISYALAGKAKLEAAGHPFYWHPFNGGHTANAGQTLVMYDDLASSVAP